MNIKEEVKLIFLAFLSLALFGSIGLIEKELSLRAPEIYLERPFVPANIVVNNKRIIGKLPGVWRALAQGGEEQGKRMLESTTDLVKKIGIKYIRLDHIYDDDYYGVVKARNSDGSLSLDWSNLDKTVEDVLASGAKPFFSMSYMPGLIADSKIGVPNWQDWQNLVFQTISHYSGQIDNLYYEVWNEPSLDHFGGWRMWGDKDYRLLYYYAVMGANQTQEVKPFKIGGPAIPEMDSDWIRLLFDYCLENNLRLDFISWHRYSFDVQQFISDVYEVNVLLNKPEYKSFLEIEKIISEWGPNPEKDTVYSSQVAASHLLAVVRRLLDKVEWVFAFEVKDGPDDNQSGWGILSHERNGIKPKPRYYMYEWLAGFEGERLELLGEGTNITGLAVKKDRNTKVILTNYNPYEPRDEFFQLTLAGLDNASYRLLRQELYQSVNEQVIEVNDGLVVLNLSLPAYGVLKLELVRI